MDNDSGGTPRNRRQFLKATGVTALAASLAGCTEQLTTHTFEADHYSVSAEDRRRLDLRESNEESVVVERGASAAAVELEVTMTSHVARYWTETDEALSEDWSRTQPGAHSAGVVSTPKAEVLDESRNPLASTPLERLIEGETGRTLRRGAGLGRATDVTWRHGLRKVRTTETTLVGEDTTMLTYAGVLVGDGGPDRIVLFHAARTGVGSDAVLMGFVDRRSVPHDYESGTPLVGEEGVILGPELRERIRLAELFTDAVRLGGGDTGDPTPSRKLQDVRLVQTVADTTVTKGSGVDVDDPPLIAGYNVAPVFDLLLEDPDELGSTIRITVEVVTSSTDTYHCDIAKTQAVAIAEGSEMRGEFHANARNADTDDDLPVFPIAPTVSKVTVTLSDPTTDTSYHSVTLKEGQDFFVRTLEPLKVGFVTVRDPDEGANYGNEEGRAHRYTEAVEAAVEYLQRAYPGGLIAYRHDAAALVGKRDSVDDAAFKDYKWAKTYLDSVVGVPFFPANGTVWAHGVPQAAGVSALKSHGFDVTVLIVPWMDVMEGNPNYYQYHYDDPPGGLFPGSHDAAVSSLESGNFPWVVSTVAQEIGHFMEGEPYREESLHPLAQRDDDGQNDTVGDEPIDWDHARDEDSDHDGDGNVDEPGVRSTGYDLTDGRFSVVNGFEFDGTSFKVHDPPQDAGQYVTTQLHSYMSYASGSLWADSRITRDLINSDYWGDDGSGSSGPTAVLTATGRVTADGYVEYDETLSTTGVVADPGRPKEADRDRPVTVTLVDPNGDPVARTRVPDAVHQEHHLDAQLNLVQFTLPFPPSVANVRTERLGRTTRLNPLTRPIRDALERVPEEGFVTDSEHLSKRANATLDRVGALMDDRAFGEAADAIRKDLRPSVDEGTTDHFEAGLNQPTRTDLLDLLDDVEDRLLGLEKYDA